jgi:hypothetical protein
LKKTYCPPVSGNIAAASALLNAPVSDISPATTHTLNCTKGEPSSFAISAGFIKMPEPIIVPITISTVVVRPRVRLKEPLPPSSRTGGTGSKGGLETALIFSDIVQ